MGHGDGAGDLGTKGATFSRGTNVKAMGKPWENDRNTRKLTV